MKAEITAAFDADLSGSDMESMRDEAAADRLAIERWESEGGRFLVSEEALGALPQVGHQPPAVPELPFGRSSLRAGSASDPEPESTSWPPLST
jgi:hypothetical protein